MPHYMVILDDKGRRFGTVLYRGEHAHPLMAMRQFAWEVIDDDYEEAMRRSSVSTSSVVSLARWILSEEVDWDEKGLKVATVAIDEYGDADIRSVDELLGLED